ncbi:MAG: hypothetical protein ACSLE6_17525 [Mycobacterium sp.]
MSDQPEQQPEQPPHWPGAVPPGAEPRRSRKWWIGGTIAAIVVLLASGIAAVALSPGGEGGAETPEAAVLNFLAAVEQEDPFAAANLLYPPERQETIRLLDSAEDTAMDADYQEDDERTAVLQGLEVATDDVHTSVERIGDDLARVAVTDGSVTVAFDPEAADDGLEGLFTDDDQMSETWHADDEMVASSESGDAVYPSIMTVRDDDAWFVSLVYSVVDRIALLRDDAPRSQRATETESFESPEAAALGFTEGLVSTLNSGDIEPVARALSPNYGRLLMTYEALFSELDKQDVELVGTPKFSAESTGDSTKVTIENLQIERVTDSGDVESVRFHDDCVTVDGDTSCDQIGINPFAASLFSPRKTGIIAVQDGAGWHVDPVDTYVGSIADVIGSASSEEVAIALYEGFDATTPALRLEASETVEPGDYATVTLRKGQGSLAGIGVAVLDIPVQSGDAVGVYTYADTAAEESWRVVGASGELARGTYSDGQYFYAPDTETVKLVMWGIAGEEVEVSVEAF